MGRVQRVLQCVLQCVLQYVLGEEGIWVECAALQHSYAFSKVSSLLVIGLFCNRALEKR